MPFAWQSARYCLDHNDNVLHFPAGSYIKQISTKAGRDEMNAMIFVKRALRALDKPLYKCEPGSYDQKIHLWATEYKRQHEV